MSRPRPDRQPSAAEARAEVEARRAEDRAARTAALDAHFGGAVPGRPIIVVSWLCTAVFTLATIPAVLDAERTWTMALTLGVSVLLFFAGCALFVVDLVLAAARSRDDVMGIGGLFFLAGVAPRPVQVQLLGSFAAQIVVAVTAAAIHPFTPLAFGTLVPTVGLALCGLWSVRHGYFEPAGAS